MKMYWKSGGIAPHFLNLNTRWRWSGQFYTLATLPLGKNPQYPLDRRLCVCHRTSLDMV